MCEREREKRRIEGGEGSIAAVYLKVHVTETRRYTYLISTRTEVPPARVSLARRGW